MISNHPVFSLIGEGRVGNAVGCRFVEALMKARSGWHGYTASWADQHGGYDLRRAPAPVRCWQQLAYGTGRVLALLRVRPVAVMLVALALAAGVPYLAGRGGAWALVAAAVVLLATFAGAVETALGVMGSRQSAAAPIWEAVAARLREVAFLVAWVVLGAAGPLVVACGLVTGLHEYVRAQAPAVGLGRMGMQTAGDRPMRVAVMVVSLALAGLAGDELAGGVAVVAAAVWLLLGVLGLGQLVGAVRRS